MRQKLHEILCVPPEYSNGGAPEYTEPPDEFNRFAPPVEEEEKSDRIRRVMLLLAVAGLVTLGIFLPRVRIAPPPEDPSATAAPIATDVPSSTATNEQTPQPTSAPTSTPTPSPTPVVLTGKIHIVVYADVFGMESAMTGEWGNPILADETFDAESFTSYKLPELPTMDGYTAKGYVLLAESGDDYFFSLYNDMETPHAIGSVALGDEITVQDLGIVPLNEEGVHEAEVHTVWIENDGSFVLEFYDGDLFGKYPVGFPMYSDGLLYLAVFPTPEREGYTFAGWSDENGNIIDAVTYFDFYKKLPGAQTMEDRDWSSKIPCKLNATWTDESGNLTQFVAEPGCHLIYFHTHSVANAVVTLTDREHTTSVKVRIWDAQIDGDAVLEHTFAPDEISLGIWQQYGIDVNDFYSRNMATYEALGSYPQTVLEVTMSYRLDDGTEKTITNSVTPQPEDYVDVYYDDENEEANEYTFPGCFVAAVLDSENPTFRISQDSEQILQQGDITVTVSVNGEEIPEERCRIEELVDTFEYDGVTYTLRSYYFVMQRPSSFPTHGKATVRLRQRLIHYDFETEKIYEIDY